MPTIPSQRQSGLSYYSWLKKYHPKKFLKYQIEHLKVVRSYRVNRIKNKPDEFMEAQRVSARKYRKEHATNWDTYNREYQKKWLKDPINYRTHQLTCGLKSVLCIDGYISETSIYYPIRDTIAYIKTKMEKGMVVSHTIPIRHLVRFNFDIALYVIHDLSNIKVTTRAENSKLRHYITDESLEVAELLERKYPLECKGLYKYLLKEQPKYQPAILKYFKKGA